MQAVQQHAGGIQQGPPEPMRRRISNFLSRSISRFRIALLVVVAELRAVLSPEEARALEIYYDVEAHGEMHHKPEKNVLWVASSIVTLANKLELDEASARVLLARARGKLLAARRERRPTPAVDQTHYVGWNAMFASACLLSPSPSPRD